MERLTNHFSYCECAECKYYDEELAKCNKCKIFITSTGHCHDKKVWEKLRDYEDLEEKGLLLKLPCKIGTTVYDIRWWDNITKKVKVGGETYYKTVYKHKVSKSKFSLHDYDDIGKEVFLTKEEAEKALERKRCEE